MKFLIDAQLPPALARHLTALGHDAAHVMDLGMLDAPDTALWSWAARNNAVLITKDADFADRWVRGSTEVAVVWVRVGNTSRGALITIVDRHLPRILNWLADGETLIELR